jgi:FlaA1/EpsC-like NDP-sugar epimerase/UDP-N-acetylmuramyl pentapeptide phosphotransferase/UDP-N-acetylglucosamine-1-phosphate transferase
MAKFLIASSTKHDAPDETRPTIMTLLAGGLFALLTSAAIGLLIVRHASRLGLVVRPTDRSSHHHPTPQGGGVGMVVAVTLVSMFVLGPDPGPAYLILAVAFPLALVGWVDDRRPLSAALRLVIQAILISLLMALPLGSLKAPTLLSLSFGALGIAALLIGIWWVNLFNFMDGIDGIAGSQALTMLASALVLASLSDPRFTSTAIGGLAFLTLCAVTGFLIINWPPAKIFMGDVGSTWLAFVIFGLALHTIVNGNLKVTTWLILGSIFIADATVTLLTRVLRGEKWAQPHRSHAYQLLSRGVDAQRTRAHRIVTVSVIGLNMLWVAPLAWFSQTTPESEQALAAVSLAYLPLVIAAFKIGAGRPTELGANLAIDRLASMSQLLPPRALVAVLFDIGVSLIAWVFAFLVVQPAPPGEETLAVLLLSASVVTITQICCFIAMRLYRGIWRFVSFRDLRQIGKAVALATLISTTLLFLIQRGIQVPRSALLLNPLILLVLMAAGRIGFRWWKERSRFDPTSTPGTPLLVLGAGQAGAQVVRGLSGKSSWTVVSILDDKKEMIGREIDGIRITGTWDELADVARFTEARHAFLAIGSQNRTARRRAFDLCERAGVKLLVLPDIEDALAGQISSSSIRDIDVDDLLGRNPVRLDNREVGQMLTGRAVLITGAGGSIGSDLCRQVARFNPSSLVLFEASEYALYQITDELGHQFPSLRLLALVGDIRNRERLDDILSAHRPEIVFHAAAYKHVPLMEVENAWQAVSNNVLGTVEVLDAANRHSVRKVVLVSTDKAVNPTNVMGATKRLAELIALRRPPHLGPQIVMVRFGNVLGSTGSVVPKFKAQIARGGPITVTHPDIRRYFMSVSEASQLVLQAAAMGRGGEVFVLDMGDPVKIVDLAKDLIRLSGASENEVAIEFSGLRPGEKLFEELLADGESTLATHHPKVRISKASDTPDDEWESEVLAWIRQPGPVPDEEVKAMLMRLVPEYSPPGATESSNNEHAERTGAASAQARA